MQHDLVVLLALSEGVPVGTPFYEVANSTIKKTAMSIQWVFIGVNGCSASTVVEGTAFLEE